MKKEGFKRLGKVFEAFDRPLAARVHVTGSMETILKELGEFPAKVFKLLYTDEQWKDLCALDDLVHAEKTEDKEKEQPKRTTKRPREEKVVEPKKVAEKAKASTSKPKEKPKVIEKPKEKTSESLEEPVVENEEEPKRKKDGRAEKKKQKQTPQKMGSRNTPPKKDPEVRKQHKQKEEEDDDDYQCAVMDEISTSQRLCKMKESVAAVFEIMPKLSSKFLPNEKVVPPNPADAQEGRAELLLQDMRKLGTLLNENTSQCECITEKAGKLYSWWRVCHRAFAFESLMTHFRITHKGAVKSEYAKLCAQLRTDDIKCCGYTSATRYVLLSKFLQQFPLFMYQTELVGVNKWFDWLANGGPTEDPSFDKDFWSQKSLSQNK